PAVAHAHVDRSVRQFRRFVLLASTGFAALVLPFVAFVAIWGEWALGIYGGQYAGYGHIVALVGFATLFQAIGFTSARGLFAMEHAEQDMIGNVVTVALLLLGGLWAISQFGLWGAA